MKRRKVRVRLAIAGLSSALALGIEAYAAAADPASPIAARVPLIYQKSRSFRVPFHLDPAERARRRELQLWVSDDFGRSWKQRGTTTPDRPSFTFREPHDGEFWLAVRTVDAQGQLHPGNDAEIEPSIKVIVDTAPPAVALDPQVRSASLASIRWAIRDEYPDEGPPILEYQVEGSDQWHPIPGSRPGLLGSVTWDSGFAAALKVRATVADRAGNKAQTIAYVPASAPETLAAAPPAPPAGPPPVAEAPSMPGPAEPVAPTAAREVAAQDPASSPSPSPAALPSAEQQAMPPSEAKLAASLPSALGAAPPADPGPPPGAAEGSIKASGAMLPGAGGAPIVAYEPTAPKDPTPADPNVGTAALANTQPPAAPAGAGQVAGIPTLRVVSRRFPLDYAVDDIGPEGPAVVELWITKDAGQTWKRHAKDPDRFSPFMVELEGPGTYGVCLVARDAKGQGKNPPVPGEPPQLWVEVAPDAGGAPADRSSRRVGLLQRAFGR
jgi:hypothetical protein